MSDQNRDSSPCVDEQSRIAAEKEFGPDVADLELWRQEESGSQEESTSGDGASQKDQGHE